MDIKDSISNFIKIIFFLVILGCWNNQAQAYTVLGTGTSALLGGDLTDPENNGVDGSNTNWNWSSIDASSEKYWHLEGSYNVFDNKVGSSHDKWCCNGPTQWISVGFSQSYVLTHFTITSGNDVAGRDPDIFKIQGSNNGSDWTDIYSYSNNGTSPWGSTRYQVIKWTGGGDDFDTPAPYSYFRYYVTSVVSGSMHQINEIEYFGTADATPTLSSSTPADDATDVTVSDNIVLNFSENVDAESGNITIKKTSDNSTVETIDVTGGQVTGSGSTQITVNPSSDLTGSTEYYVLIDATAFDDATGNSYAGISSTTALSFTTEDNIAPTLSSSTPADNATGVAVNANIVLTFSESVSATSGNVTIKKTSDNSTVEQIGVTSVQVTGNGAQGPMGQAGGDQITINPSSDFDSSTEYYLLIDATAFEDGANNAYAGISSTTALSFTSVDNANPTLSSSTPADDATDVELDANIVLIFNESVDAESGNITIKKTSDDSTVEQIDVTSGQVTGSGSSQITVNPSSDFDPGIEYYVLIDATAFDDASSNSYAGISSTTALSFTSNSKTDPTTDKKVTGSIKSLTQQVKTSFTSSVGIVTSRLNYLRQNRTSNNFTNNNIKLDFDNVMLASLMEKIPISTYTQPNFIPDDWSLWSEGSISVSRIGDGGSSENTPKETDSQSVAFGFDKKINESDLLGFAIQYGLSDADIGSDGTGIDTESLSLTIYRTKPFDNNNFMQGLIGFGIIESDSVRKSSGNTLTGSRNGNQLFGSINYGKTFGQGEFSATPIVRLDLGYTELDSYTETGTDALSYSKQTFESALGSIGMEINDIIKFSDSLLKPFGVIEYSLDFSNSSDVKMNYVSDTTTTYTFVQGVSSTHLASSEIGFHFEARDNIKLTSSYKRIQGNESERTDSLRFGFNYRSMRKTDYSLNIGGNNDLAAVVDVTRNVNGLHLNFNARQAFNDSSDKNANVSLSKKF